MAQRILAIGKTTMVASAEPYERKFADFIRLLAESKEDAIMIHNPEVIGDTDEENVESINRFASAENHLAIVPRNEG